MMPFHAFSDSSSGSLNVANGGTLNESNNSQDNPVGIVKKSIYIIKNDINDKVYIGQSINPENRFKGHIQDKNRKQHNSAIDGAIKKYGEKHFWFEILEKDVVNYNEREKYWIRFYNSICPNGYNILDGGEVPPVNKGLNNNKSKFSQKDLEELVELLKKPNITLQDIANYFSVSYRTISNFNKGKTYHNNEIDYPIRKFQISGEFFNMVESETVDNVIQDLLNTNLSYLKISQKYNINETQVVSINNGDILLYKRRGYTYPLTVNRQRHSIELVNSIKSELKKGVLSKNQVAKKFHVNYGYVNAINAGRIRYDKDTIYPIKKHEGRLNYTEETWEEIRKMLKRGVSPKTIVTKLNLPNLSLVYDINKGKTHRSENYTYPIQKIQNKYSIEKIRKICNDILNTNLTLSEIAKKYQVHKSTVICLKNGSWKKYRLPEYEYPLRPNK